MNRIEKLIKDLTEASQLYYSGDSSSIIDRVFDNMLNELRELDPSNAFLFKTGYGYIPPKHLKKSKHSSHVGSLDKLNIIDILDPHTFFLFQGFLSAFLCLSYR